MLLRRSIEIRGVVQGVGFRPFVFGLARELNLAGFVRNQMGRVVIEVEGPARALDDFEHRLRSEPPPLARIEKIEATPIDARGDDAFRIEASSREGPAEVFISPDVATCEACLRELRDPNDRRFAYPFINCTHCGPRLTIIQNAPYDRAQTTMSGFPLCGPCRAEYENPSDRRFHAEPVACAKCGPKLSLRDADGRPIESVDALSETASRLLAGKIGAVKGIGGFHLACDARNASAVAALRSRKLREEKPFAVMVANLEIAERLAQLDDAARALLTSPARPIVLVRAREQLAEGIAPGSPLVGLMLPYAPLHHVLLDALQAAPLVMTSANRSDEPIAYEDAPALEQLRGIADFFLTHDRPIHMRCDDSVARVVNGAPLLLRRSRGFAPAPLTLPAPLAKPTLALGGHLKGAFALGDSTRAFVSHHLGDLDHAEAFRALRAAISHYEALFQIRPERIVHDAHPDYASTRLAIELAEREGLERMSIQHHRAHFASALADAGIRGGAIGVIFDGAGFGDDGTIWGGEFFLGDAASSERVGHLAHVRMPGGERAMKEPWRMALAHAEAAGLDGVALVARVAGGRAKHAKQLLASDLSPRTSSIGRLFDAAAFLSGLSGRVSFEGQAPMALESLAATQPMADGYALEHRSAGGTIELCASLLFQALVRDVDAGVSRAVVARRFHDGLAESVADVCAELAARSGFRDVVLSGGVFVNAVLSESVASRLFKRGLSVHHQRRVPPNDGGLSFGQLATLAARDGAS